MYTAYSVIISLGIMVVEGFYLFRSSFERWLSPLLRAIPNQVKPDHLSWSRVPLGAMVAFFLFFYPMRAVAVILYSIAWITDLLDGALARHRNQFSIWGCRIDPFVDKFLNGVILAGHVLTGEMSYFLWATLWIIVSIDLITTILAGLIFYFFEIRIKSNIFGKWKFGAQCAGCTALMLSWISLATLILEAAALLGIFSAISYGYNAYCQLRSRRT